ncbi:LacI family DNA-binding transcriptional regulator [Deinococcus sp. Marseille-Q6407]|uniref:LacI family DNA-binding transcriptional regulator n=1 Tax=Deinococcus sp. Marseille-Q6407 TaxID=2969223 RepID=UPI0021BFDB9F|nr:LacI family DNA-binding transcriptional regulator [Deinococcus sp. Marseille-Q6407]
MSRGGRSRSGRPTVHTVAEAAGVGVGTVSRVLNNHPSVRGETRERVLAVIEELNYRPTGQARRLPVATGEQALIGVLIAGLSSVWESRVMRGVETALDGQDFGLMAFAVGAPQRAEQAGQAGHFSQLAQGLLLCDEAAYQSWAALGLPQPAVRVGALAEEGVDYVAIDNRYGGLIAGEYAATLPGEIVGVWTHYAPPRPQRSAIRQGFSEGVESAGRQATHIEIDADDHLPRVASELLDRLPQRVTIMAHSDELAVALLTEAQARGRAAGQDLKIIGYGDHPAAALVGLTTVHQPLEDMAQRGTELLLERVREHAENRPARERQFRLLAPRLALRGSA